MYETITQTPYLIALLIFLARVADVSLGTFRTIVVFRGHKFLAAFIGFFEILIWLVAAGQVLKHLDQWYLAIAYAAGFAAGNYIGMWLECRFAIGSELIRCISYSRSTLSDVLRDHGYKAITLDGNMGEDKPVEIIFVIEKRRRVPGLIKLINETDPSTIYSVADVKSVYDGPDLLPRRSFIGSALRLPGKRR